MRAILTTLCLSLIASGVSHAQASAPEAKVDLRAEEAAIRAAAAKQLDSTSYTSDAIFWSGAFARPVIRHDSTRKRVPIAGERLAQRRNTRQTEKIVRLEVAASGDLAYDFSDFTLSYDLADTGEHVSFQGSSLRVWKKVGGQWRLAVWFARPYDKQP